MAGPSFAIIFAVVLVALHIQQVQMLSGSVGEYWKRKDERARASKLFFGLGLGSCAIIIFWPIAGIVCAVAFVLLSLGFSMKEWKR